MNEKYLSSPCWMVILKYLSINKPHNMSEVSRRCNITYSHTVKLINMFVKIKLLKSYRENRNRTLELTKLGRESASLCGKLVDKLNIEYDYYSYGRILDGRRK